MTSGISTRSADIDRSRAFSCSRSVEPGRYARFGSFTGGGTRVVPEMDATSVATPRPAAAATVRGSAVVLTKELMDPQNRYFNANCMMRGSAAVVILPNSVLVNVVFGLPTEPKPLICCVTPGPTWLN